MKEGMDIINEKIAKLLFDGGYRIMYQNGAMYIEANKDVSREHCMAVAMAISSLLKEEGWKSPEIKILPNNCLNNKCSYYDEHSEENCSSPDDFANSDKCNPYDPEQMSEIFEKAMRARGWFHKDDPTDVMVEEECPECRGKEMILAEGCDCDYCKITPGYLPCHSCNGSGTISRPMTVGEVLEAYRRLLELVDIYKEYAELLIQEISSMVGLCYVHGWKSENVEKGKNLREKIDALSGGKIKEE